MKNSVNLFPQRYKTAELINLPDDHVMGAMVAVGKGTKDPWPKPGQLPLDEVVIENRF